MRMTTSPEEPLDHTLPAIRDILHTLGVEEDVNTVREAQAPRLVETYTLDDRIETRDDGIQDIATRLIRPEQRTVEDAVAMTTVEGFVPAHHLGAGTVRASYVSAALPGSYLHALEIPSAYTNTEDITIDTEALTPEAETVFGGLADEMLGQTGRTVSPVVRDLLVRHISAGMEMTIVANRGSGQDPGEDPMQAFLKKVQSGLLDGSLVRGLEAASELHALLPEPTERRGVLGKLQGRLATIAAMAERQTGRQAQVRALAERSREEGSLRLDDLRAGDEITLTMTVDNLEPRDQIERKGDPLIFTRTIRGKIERVEEQSYGNSAGSTQQGAIVRITEDARNSELHFTDEPFAAGSIVTLFATESTGTVSRSYDHVPIVDEELSQGYPPILIDADGFPSEMQVCNLAGYASMGLSQMTLNGQTMFQEGWRPQADADPDNFFGDEDW